MTDKPTTPTATGGSQSAIRNPQSEIVNLVVTWPKAEVHLHLEGAVEIETLRELAGQRGLPPPPADLYDYTDFGGFLKAFKIVCDYLAGPAEYETVTRKLLGRLQQQGVVYAEIYVAAGVLLWQRKPLEAIFEGIEAGYRRARADGGPEARWILDATRQFGAEAAMEMTRRAVPLRDRGVIGIGIGGDEERGAPELFREVYAYARALGLRLTAHAGETAGPESIWGALRALGAERIGHGLAAARDARLIEHLAEKQVPVDICLSSNLRTGAVRAIEEHPLRGFLDAGLLVSLSTDDPAMFGTDLAGEYLLAHEGLGLSIGELRRLAANSFRASFQGRWPE
jgi:adenosine deaminase/aminodeoxyfutalosine deaminase